MPATAPLNDVTGGRSRLRRNLGFNIAGQAATLGLAVLSVRYVFRGLGDEAFGLVLFNLTMGAAITTALELGLTSTTVKEVAAHFETNPSYVHELTRTATTLYWALYLVALSSVLLAAPAIVDGWLHLHEMPRATAVEAVRLLSAGTLVVLPQGLYASLLRGRQRMGWTNLISISTLAVQQAGIVAIVGMRGDLVAVGAWFFGCSMLAVVTYVIVCGRDFGWSALAPGWSGRAVRRTASFTGHMMAVSATSMIHTQSDKVAASRFLPVADFGFYAFISSVCARVSLLSGAVIEASLPSLAKLVRDGDRERMGRQQAKLHDLLCIASVPVLSAVVYAIPVVVPYVFSTAVAERLVLPTVLLCVGFYMNSSITVPYVVCVAMGRPDIPSRTNLLGLVFVLPATIVLVWRFGMVGGGLSWILFHLFSYSYLVPRACRECLHQPLAGWYLMTLKYALAGGGIYGVGWLLVVTLRPPLIAGTLLAYSLCSLTFGMAMLRLAPAALRADILAVRSRLFARL